MEPETTITKVINGRLVTFSRVRSIEPVGVKHVYDLEVKNDHNYFANGISVHNCEYHKILKHFGGLYGKELYRQSSLYLRYFHRNLDLYPSGPMKRTLRGDCLTGDTLVNTSRGFVQFDELDFREGFTKTTDQVDSPFGPQSVSHTYRKESREIVKVVTRNKFQLRGTPEHPVLVFTPELNYEWRQLKDLRVGDWIVSRTKGNSPLFGNNSLSKAQATLLGLFTANGYGNSISSNDEDVIKRFRKAVKAIPGLKAKTYPAKDLTKAAHNHVVLTGAVGRKGYDFKDVLSEWGYASVKSAKKQIPLSVRTAPKEILHEYLEAYFSCDGHINGGPTKKARKNGVTTNPEVELASASRKLMRQLQVILLQVYGIVGRLGKSVDYKNMSRVSYQPKHYVTWLLSMSGYDAWLFLKTFKRAKVHRYAERFSYCSPGYGSDRRQVPHVRKALLDFWKGLGRYYELVDGERVKKPPLPTFVSSRAQNGNGPLPEFLIYQNPDTPEFLQFVKTVDKELYRKLRRFFALEAHYEEVVSVKELNKKMTVYDLTVPDTHAFTANGLSSHNTRVFSATDELGWFPFSLAEEEDDLDNDERERANADEVYTALENSLSTVRTEIYAKFKQGVNHLPTAYNFNLSSPSSWKDKICRLLKESEGSRYSLGLRLPTWDINPMFSRDHPVIVNAYRKNPVHAERDYGANPPSVNASRYDKDQIQRLFSGRNHHALKYLTKDSVTEGGAGRVYADLVTKYNLDRWPASALALDAGLNNNSFSLALGNLAGDVLRVTSLLELIPFDRRKIDFSLMLKFVLKPLIEQCNVHYVCADRWNSILMLQTLQEESIPKGPGDQEPRVLCEQFSVKRRDFDQFDADFVHSENLILPAGEQDFAVTEEVMDYKKEMPHKPAAHLYLQFLTVREFNGTIVKGDGYTDDNYRALILLGSRIKDPKVQAHLRKFQPKANEGSRLLGVVGGRSTISVQF